MENDEAALVGLLRASVLDRTWFSFADDSMKAAFQDSANAFPSSQLITLKIMRTGTRGSVGQSGTFTMRLQA